MQLNPQLGGTSRAQLFVVLTQSMTQFPVHPSITPSLCLYTWVLIIEAQRSLIIQRESEGERVREGTEREREIRGTTEEPDRDGMGIRREKSDPFATEMFQIIIPDTNCQSRNSPKSNNSLAEPLYQNH